MADSRRLLLHGVSSGDRQSTQRRPVTAIQTRLGLSQDQLSLVTAIYEQAFGPGLRVPFGELAHAGPAGLLLALLDGADPAGSL